MNSKAPHRIVSVNTADQGGGAEQVARQLFEAYRRADVQSWLVVGDKRGDDQNVMTFWNSPHIDYRPYGKWWRRLQLATARRFDCWRGIEDFNYPYTHYLRKITGARPDLVHLHNLHGGYFDLFCLPRLTRKFPVVWTLHDLWPLTGHCAYPLGCGRWRDACGKCPDLNRAPAIARDATAHNLKRKRDIFSRCRLYLTAPSQWGLDHIAGSALEPAVVESKVIPGAVDLRVFHPGDRIAARRRLGLPEELPLVLFAAHAADANPYKDFATARKAVERLAATREIGVVVLGGTAPVVAGARVFSPGFVGAREQVADYFRAVDVFLHAAPEEMFGLVIAEAMACATPVVATATGGIPEVMRDGVDGFLVRARDDEAIAARMRELLDDPGLRREMGKQAAERAARCFDLEMVAGIHLDWFREILYRRALHAKTV